MSRKYTITLNEEQLMLVSSCVEDIHRFLCGDMELRNATSVLDVKDRNVLQKRLEQLKPLVTPELLLYQEYDWAGNGCPNGAQRRMIAATYYLYREMLHKYTLANNYKNVYTSPTLTCEDGGEPIKITWEDEQCPNFIKR